MMGLVNGDLMYLLIGFIAGLFAGMGWGYASGMSKITALLTEDNDEKR